MSLYRSLARTVTSIAVLLLVLGTGMSTVATRARAPQQPVPVVPEPSGRAVLSGFASPDGVARAGLPVLLEGSDGLIATTATDAEGAYRFLGLAGATYTLQALDDQGLPFDVRKLTLAPGQRVALDLGRTPVARGATLAQAPSPCTTTVTGTASVSGVVTASGTNLPLSNVSVSATGPSRVASAMTDAQGRYQITGLPAGSYRVGFFPSFSTIYLDQYYNGKSDIVEANQVTVAEGATVTDINATLAIGGQITGRVTGDGGIGLGGISVQTYRIVAGRRVFADSDVTGTDGSYELRRLPPGTYVVETAISGSTTVASRPYLNSATGNLEVGVGATLANTNITLTRGAQFSGRVTNSAGTGVSNVSVQLYDPATNAFLRSVAFTGSDGTYITQGITPGSYKVFFNVSGGPNLEEFYNNKQTASAADPITLAGTAVTPNINAQLEPGGVITGVVTGPGGAPLREVDVYVDAPNVSFISAVSTDVDGSYRIEGLPTGAYSVEFDPSGSSDPTVQGYVREYYNDRASSGVADRVSVTAPATVTNINAELAPGAVISGCVSGADTGRGLGFSEVDIEVVSTEGGTTFFGIQSSNGTYRTPGLRPGSYTVQFQGTTSSSAERPGYASEYYDNALSFRDATPIVVGTANVPGINAVLERGGAFTGRVVGEGGAPLDDLVVDVLDGDGDLVTEGFTNSAGRYTTRGVPEGSYTLRFRPFADGVSAAYIALENGPHRATVGAFTTVDIQLARGGQVSGRVTGPAGVGLDDVLVDLYGADNSVVAIGFTDATGAYITSGVPVGSYRVGFRPFGSADQYAPEFYNDRLDLASADPVSVGATGVTANINAELATGSAISGRITAPGGTSPGAVQVEVYTAAGVLLLTRAVGGDGNYTTAALPSGSYKLCFVPQSGPLLRECYNDKPTLLLADTLVVAAPTPISNISAELAPGSQITGKVVGSDGTPLAGVNVAVFARVAPAQSGTPLAVATTGADGTFTTGPGLAAGGYTLRLTPPAGTSLATRSVDVTVTVTGTNVALPDVVLPAAQRLNLPLLQR